MIRKVAVLAGLLAVVSPAAGQSQLRRDIDRALADPFVKTCRLGVRVVDVESGQVLYSLNAEDAFIPASNMKLLTTAAALDQLGPNFTYVTTFALRGDDLLVFASGDAGLGDERLAKRRNEPIDAPFVRAARAIKRAGKSCIGDLVVDATVFDDEYFHPSWPANQRHTWYAAEVAGFNFNDNCVDFTVVPSAAGRAAAIEPFPANDCIRIINRTASSAGSHKVWFSRQGVSNTVVAGGTVRTAGRAGADVPVHNPPAFAASVLANVLAREGVAVTGSVRFQRLRQADGSLPGGIRVIHRHEQLIGELVWRANTFSQNFIAEALFKSLSAYPNGSPAAGGVGSWSGGGRAALEFIRRRRLTPPDGLVIDDGCGLSKANRLSPRLLTELLMRMARHPSAELFRDSLATSGVEGTLRKRFARLGADDVLRAKTGSLANASSLSGYVRADDDRELAFSILFDGYKPGAGWKAKALIDKIVIILADSSAKDR